MSENNMWSQIRPQMRKLDPVRVETREPDGIPDVEYIGGWVELKFARTWPVRGGVLQLDHYTQQQRTWGFRRWHAGGVSLLMLKVKHDWMLFDAFTAFHHVGRENYLTLKSLALVHHRGLVKDVIKEMLPWLTEDLDAMTAAQKCRWMRVRSMKTPMDIVQDNFLNGRVYYPSDILDVEMGQENENLSVNDLIWYWEQ